MSFDLQVIKYFERQGQTGAKLISYMMCFGGGVFLAIYMLHMSPDVQEIMNFSIVKPYKIVLVPGCRVVGCLDAGWRGAWTQGGAVPERRVVGYLDAG